MADKSISELTAATQVGSTDLFVLEQSGVAKKLTGQILENWLVALADGHGGIQDIEKTSTSGLIDTYTITLADETVETFTVTNGKAISSVVKTGAVPPSLTDSYRINYNDGTHYDFTVTNGKGVTSIEKTSTSGLVDTYTITYNDSTTGTITVTNGKAITSITDKWAVSSSNTQTPSTWYNAAPEMTPTNRYLWHYQVIAYNDNTSVDTTKAVVGVYGDTGDAWYMWIKYAANEPTQDSDMVTIPNKWIGIYSGTSSTAPVHYTSYDWYEYKGEKGDTGDAAEVTSTAIVYQASESGTTVPTGTWVDTVPTVVQGQFLWTRVTVNWNDGTSAVWYSVSYVAIDGEGSPGSQTPLVDSGSGVVGTATAYSRQDHQHPLNVPSSGEPAMDGTASRGNADTYSRSDHVHPTDTSRARVADMAAAYSQRTYAKGELCIYENVLYRCKDGIPTAEAWNSSHWETTNIGVELGDLNGALNNKMNATPPNIELKPAANAGHGGFIDFHYNGSSADYTSRIIENASGNINVSGSVSLGSPLPVASGGTGNNSVDTTPTESSSKMVTSGGVYDAIKEDPKMKGNFIAQNAYLEISKVNQNDPSVFVQINLMNNTGTEVGLYMGLINTAGQVAVAGAIPITNLNITTGTNKIKIQNTSGTLSYYANIIVFSRTTPIQVYRSDTGLTS